MGANAVSRPLIRYGAHNWTQFMFECELDPKLAELADAIDQARDEQVNGTDDFEIAER